MSQGRRRALYCQASGACPEKPCCSRRQALTVPHHWSVTLNTLQPAHLSHTQLQVLDTRQPWTPGAAAPAQGHRGAPPGPRAPMAQPQHQTMTLPHHLHSHAGAMGGGVATGAADCGPSAKRARVAVEDVLQQHAAKDLVSELMGWGRSNSQMPPQGSQQQQQQQHAPHGEPVAAAAAATLSLPG